MTEDNSIVLAQSSPLDLIKATHGSPDKPLRIGDLEIPCYVLQDGRRVLIQLSVISALGMASGGSTNPRKRDQLATFASEKGVEFTNNASDRLSIFASSKSLQPYISAELLASLVNPIRFRTTTGSVSAGYEATILADICEAVLQARADGKLNHQQEHIAKQCEALVRGFARVGIIALVDEATGYQEARDRDALHKLLEMYIAKELLPWAKRFPNEFYQEMFRLRGWQYRPLSGKRPRFVGHLTNEIVYDRLPNGVLEELRKINPIVKDGRRAHKHHQYLTDEIGNPHLEKHLVVVTALMRVATSWGGFMRLLDKAVPKPNSTQQLEMFEEEDTD